MSDIKIQPSATGSATVTLTAPTTGTARTVTLPDSTDTLAVNSDVTNKLPLAGGTMTGAILSSSTFTANSSSSGDYVRMYGSSGTGKWDIYGNGANLRFSDNDSAGSIVFDRQINASGGVAIGGTGTANTLDDYEEGTWTPVWTPAGGTIVTNTTYTGGIYTKVGNLVTISCRLYTSSVSSPTGKITISGLPYTIKNIAFSTPRFLWPILGLNGSLAGSPIASPLGNTTTLLISDWVWGTTESGSNIADKFDNDVWSHASFTYFTN